MSHDLISDCLNQIMNAKKAKKSEVVVTRYSKFLIEVLKIAENLGYLKYNLDEKSKKLKIEMKKLVECKTIKPRFFVKTSDIEKYMRRYLPSRNFGVILVSTSKGLITHTEALDKRLGGSLIAYFY